LSPQRPGGNVLAMYSVARMLQFIGLAIPPLAIIAQLSNSIDVKQMYRFLIFSICIFCLGYLLQQYSGGRRT
jgi:hypothetical protein